MRRIIHIVVTPECSHAEMEALLMYPIERRARIVEMMKIPGMVEIRELSRRMGVSESTIRRDLRKLEDEGVVQVHYGAAKLTQREGEFVTRSFPERAALNSAEKTLIARAALQLIDDKEPILLDAGSTTAAIARELQNWAHELTVVTTALNIATLLKSNPNISVILVGGVLRTPGESLVGELAEAMLDRLHVPRAFIGAAGVTIEDGVMYANPFEAQIRRKIVQRSRTVVLVADHSKFGRPGLVSVCPLSSVHHVITGNQVPTEYVEWMRLHGVAVTLVGSDRLE